VMKAVKDIKKRVRVPQTQNRQDEGSMFSNI
jgi:hypothetical protein